MILTSKLLLHYLIAEAGLLKYEDYLSAEEVVVKEKVTRNRNFTLRVTFESIDLPDILLHIKQPINFANHLVKSGKNEALFYEKFRNHPHFVSILEFIPIFIGYYPENKILIIQGLKSNFQSLSIILQPEDTNHIDAGFTIKEVVQLIGIRIAEIISICHQTLTITKIDILKTGISDFKLSFTTEDFERMLRDTNSNHKKSIIQYILTNQNLLQIFLNISDNWSRSCLIHNDLSFRNFLFPAGNTFNSSFLKAGQLIDWELAGIGDPLWDLSMLFFEIINNQQLDARMKVFAKEKLIPTPFAHDFLYAFWNSYVSRIGVKVNESADMLTKVFIYTGIRLFEEVLSSIKSDEIDTGPLPTSRAIFKKAEEMMLHPLSYVNLFFQHQSSYLKIE